MANVLVLEDLITKFNKIIMGMLNYISEYYDDDNVKNIRSGLQIVINNSPDVPITLFMHHIYSNDDYRKNIYEQNDKFFVDHDYTNHTKGDKEKILQIFAFKSMWNQFDEDTRNFIKKSMRGLMVICYNYIMEKAKKKEKEET